MNTLGHIYVASKILRKLNYLVIAGSEIPDFVPFVSNSAFSFAEIHESGEKLLKFLKQNHPQKVELALSMLIHSARYGADKFNKDIDIWLLGNNENMKKELANKITECPGVSFDIAIKSRMHNYLWTGIDLYLLKYKEDFIENVKKTYKKIDYLEISNLLAEGFGKDKEMVFRDVKYFFSNINFENLHTIENYVKVWKLVLAGLPEKDNVDVNKTKFLLEEIYEKFKNKWGDILSRVVIAVGENTAAFRLNQ